MGGEVINLHEGHERKALSDRRSIIIIAFCINNDNERKLVSDEIA